MIYHTAKQETEKLKTSTIDQSILSSTFTILGVDFLDLLLIYHSTIRYLNTFDILWCYKLICELSPYLGSGASFKSPIAGYNQRDGDQD
jgi:hypothetical protein